MKIFSDYQLSAFELCYALLWLSITFICMASLLCQRLAFYLECKTYLPFLLIPWKLATFLPVLIFLMVAGPYTNDPTWDVVSGGGMAILTYLTAPWSVGILMRGLSMSRPPRWRLVLAVFFLLFSSSWFYDGYLLLRDAAYTARWWSNLMISSLIYILAGLFWNLETVDHANFSRQRFAFERESWPKRTANSQNLPALRYLLPPIFGALFLLMGFVSWHF